MEPQTGDIWEYDSLHWGKITILLHECRGKYPAFHREDGYETSFAGHNIETGQVDEFIFNVNNMKYWRKLA